MSHRLILVSVRHHHKELAQRILDLEAQLAAPEVQGPVTAGTAGRVQPAVEESEEVEENDWILKADPGTLTLADTEGFISRTKHPSQWGRS